MSEAFVEILLVEDNPADAELTLRALRRHQLANNVFHVIDGQEALDFLFRTGPFSGTAQKPRPRLVLLDLKLPKVDGIEVLRQLKAHAELRSLPVVVLTSSREEIDVLRAYELGVNSYIVKPVEFENFASAIANVGLYWLLLNQPPAL